MITVIVPTVNEGATIGPLIYSIYAALRPSEVSVIVVDDVSHDTTGKTVLRLRQDYPTLHLITRYGRRGLGSAVKLGARHASEGPVVVMDADLSHNPKFLPNLLDEIHKGFDVVIGSRYTPGGRTVKWPGSRLAISRIGNTLARILLGVPITDPMSGYIAFRSPSIILNGCRDANFKILLEILVTNPDLRVTEVPIVFSERCGGKSKLSVQIVLLFVLLLCRLFLKRLR